MCGTSSDPEPARSEPGPLTVSIGPAIGPPSASTGDPEGTDLSLTILEQPFTDVGRHYYSDRA